ARPRVFLAAMRACDWPRPQGECDVGFGRDVAKVHELARLRALELHHRHDLTNLRLRGHSGTLAQARILTSSPCASSCGKGGIASRLRLGRCGKLLRVASRPTKGGQDACGRSESNDQ